MFLFEDDAVDRNDRRRSSFSWVRYLGRVERHFSFYDRARDELVDGPGARIHDFWWLVHNLIAHPALGVMPSKKTVWFHDYTSMKLNLESSLKASPMPEIKNRSAWLEHNVLAHIAIGVWPSVRTFGYHDSTAKRMAVDGWA